MKKRLFAFLFLIVALFLLLAAVSAEDIVSNDANNDILAFSGEDAVDNDDILASSSGNAVDNGDVLASSSKDTPDNENIISFSEKGVVNTPILSNENSDSNNSDNSSIDSNSTDANSSENIVPADSNENQVPSGFALTKNIKSTYGKKVKFSLQVLNNEGNPISNALVTFIVSSKTYQAYTDSEGVASIYLNLNSGKYTIRYYAGDISGKNTYTVKNSFKITLYKWKSGANVLRNKRIKANVPKSSLVRKMIKLARYGTPVIKFKGGKGKVVFITAGVHGNEIPSQVAAMRLIKYLESHPINGTVYIIPFINPKGTAANVRDYKGVHLNKIAHKKGSISYKTVRLIKKLKTNSYGDFHSTRPKGKPGKNSVLGTYRPTKESAVIAKYISKKSKVKRIIYKKAGAEYPGALEDEVNKKGIPAVTCEVLSTHGKIRRGSVSKALLMMKTLLRYNFLI